MIFFSNYLIDDKIHKYWGGDDEDSDPQIEALLKAMRGW
jgi:hypothetical protein